MRVGGEMKWKLTQKEPYRVWTAKVGTHLEMVITAKFGRGQFEVFVRLPTLTNAYRNDVYVGWKPTLRAAKDLADGFVCDLTDDLCHCPERQW
jgi:hypothetical protein